MRDHARPYETERKTVKARLTGVSLDGVSWDYTDGDKEAIRRLFLYLEDRRILTQNPSRILHSPNHMLQSVNDIRRYLTTQLEVSTLSEEVVYALRSMRAAARDFMEKAGPDGHLAVEPIDQSRLIGILQARFGEQLSPFLEKVDIEVDEDLLAIMPPDDKDWIPGFSTPE